MQFTMWGPFLIETRAAWHTRRDIPCGLGVKKSAWARGCACPSCAEESTTVGGEFD